MPKRTGLKPREEMSFISLFSGCGGLDLGFQQAGFRCLGAFDNNETALRTHAQNLDTPTFQVDLSKGQLPGDRTSRPMVVVAGAPCQGFSTIGKRRVDDQRNGLLLAAGKIAVTLKPAFFVAENVPAVASGAHAKYWESLRASLTEAGYTCSTLLLKASDFGVAQQRRRLFMIASRGDSEATVPTINANPVTVGCALKNLNLASTNHEPIGLDPKSRDYRIATKISAGQKLCDVRISERAVHTWNIPEVFGETSKLERAILVLVTRLRRRERQRDFGDADPVAFSVLKRELGFDPRPQLSALATRNLLK